MCHWVGMSYLAGKVREKEGSSMLGGLSFKGPLDKSVASPIGGGTWTVEV